MQDVDAAADAAVEQHLAAVADRVDDLGQRVEARGDAVELAPAVVRDDDAGGAVVAREDGVLGGEDPLDHEREARARGQPLEVAPRERLVVDRAEPGARVERPVEGRREVRQRQVGRQREREPEVALAPACERARRR